MRHTDFSGMNLVEMTKLGCPRYLYLVAEGILRHLSDLIITYSTIIRSLGPPVRRDVKLYNIMVKSKENLTHSKHLALNVVILPRDLFNFREKRADSFQFFLAQSFKSLSIENSKLVEASLSLFHHGSRLDRRLTSSNERTYGLLCLHDCRRMWSIKLSGSLWRIDRMRISNILRVFPWSQRRMWYFIVLRAFPWSLSRTFS